MREYKALNSIAYDHLRDLIHNRGLAFDTIYSETKLAAQLSISRTPMRDALNRLARERYIDILPSCGFMLHKPNQTDVIEAYHVRMMIELYCGEIIAAHYPARGTREVLETMSKALDRQRISLENGDCYSLNQFWQDDVAFHKATLGYLNISSFNIQYETFMHIFMPHHLLDDNQSECSAQRVLDRHHSTLKEHAEIIAALKSHDLERARAAIRTHLRSSARALSVSIPD